MPPRHSFQKPDFIFLITLGIIIAFGLLMLASASVPLSQEKFGTSYYYLKSQILRGLLPGLALFIIGYLLPYRFWKKFALLGLILGIVSLIAVFIPGLGLGEGGASRWLNFGLFSLQPSEFLKLAFIIYLAAWFDSKEKTIKSFSNSFVPFMILIGVLAVLLLFQPDIGTLGVISLIGMTMYFLAGARLLYFPIILGGGGILIYILTKIFPHALNRVTVFLHPGTDPKGIGYQLNQALLAIGSGGFFGRGLGQSVQKFKYLPEPSTDSILAVIGEELGFFGILLLLILFGILIFRGFRIARLAPDNFARYLASGIISWIAIQALINTAAISGLLPLTGITLPFISLGGSSLTACLAGMGILLNISKYSKN